MEHAVVENARKMVGTENRSFEAVLEKLETTRRELENEKERAEKATGQANKMRSRAQSEKDKSPAQGK
jgi:dsDNA-specific endonuclease/ATPase MutS2